MGKEEDYKQFGKLEKGVEVLEKTVSSLEKSQTEHALQVVTLLNAIREDFRKEISVVHEKLDKKTEELHTQIDGVLANHSALKMNVQKLATSVSVITGVGLYVITKVFDVAKDAFASTFFNH